MKRLAFFAVIIVILSLIPPMVLAANVDITPSFDTTVKQSAPDENFGTNSSLDMLYDSGTDPATVPQEVQESYIKFDLSSIPKGMYITSATLTLQGYGSSYFGDDDIRIHQ